MTTKTFEDALSEFLKEFPKATAKDKELAQQRISVLTKSTDQDTLPRMSQSGTEEDDFFDNVPV